jgi:hypothetical protein
VGGAVGVFAKVGNAGARSGIVVHVLFGVSVRLCVCVCVFVCV